MLQAIVLGIIQGLTEFLPISSTAHLILVPYLLGWKDPGLAFDVILHLGTLTGIIVFFRRDFYNILYGMMTNERGGLGGLNNPEGRVGWYIVVGTIPAGVAGLFFKDRVENLLRGPYTIAFSLIFFAILLWWSEAKGKKKKKLAHLGLSDAILIGCAQAIALIPGVSRSGITITAGLLRDLERETAARFAFLLSMPIILAGGLLSFLDIHKTGFPYDMFWPFFGGFLASALSGFLAIKYLLIYLSKGKVNVFVYYRILLGLLILWVT